MYKYARIYRNMYVKGEEILSWQFVCVSPIAVVYLRHKI